MHSRKLRQVIRRPYYIVLIGLIILVWVQFFLYGIIPKKSLTYGSKMILVTGAAGYIGSHTILVLLEAGYEIFAIDNFANSVEDENGQAESLKRVSELTGKEIPFVKCDLRKYEELEKVFNEQNFETIIHFAALKSVSESTQKPLDYYENNILGTLNLLKLANKYNVKKFVFSSSATVYGPPKELPIKETAQTGQGITNAYGQTKYMMEQILIDLAKANPTWKIIILRYFNPVGAHPSGRIGEDPLGVPNNLMPYINQVAVGKLPYLKVYGSNYDTKDGTGVRDYIHIMDLAKGHQAALERIQRHENLSYEIFNLGTGRGYSVREVVEAFEKASGKKIKTRVEPPRPGDLGRVYCDPSLAWELMLWRAEHAIDDMCKDAWNWQRKNPYGYAKKSHVDEIEMGFM